MMLHLEKFDHNTYIIVVNSFRNHSFVARSPSHQYTMNYSQDLILREKKKYLKELAGREQTVKSARTKPIRRSVSDEVFPPQNSGVIIIVSSLVANSAHVLAHTGGLNKQNV